MHKLSIMTAMLALLAGCAAGAPGSSSSSSSTGSPGSSGGGLASVSGECDASGVQSYLNRNWSDSLDSTLRSASGSRVLRVVRPGQVMTMEFNPYRLNAVLNPQGKIDSLHCG